MATNFFLPGFLRKVVDLPGFLFAMLSQHFFFFSTLCGYFVMSLATFKVSKPCSRLRPACFSLFPPSDVNLDDRIRPY